MKNEIVYRVCIFTLGVVPATFWFLLESFYTIGLFNNITNYWAWFLFYVTSFMGTLGFWMAMFLKSKAIKLRFWIILMMCIGVVTTLFVYFSEPRFFRGFELVVFSPVVIAAFVFWVNLKIILLNKSDAKIKKSINDRALF